MKRLHGIGGFTVIEMTLVAGIAAGTALWMAQWMGKPAAAQSMMNRAEQEIRLGTALNMMVNDLAESNASSIPWNTLAPTGSDGVMLFAFTKTTYDTTAGAVATTLPYQYTYVHTKKTPGTLYRVSPQGQAVVLTPVDPPSTSAPLVQADPNTPNVLILTLQYHPTGSAPIQIVRRVTIRG